jgi:hypothetical protein
MSRHLFLRYDGLTKRAYLFFFLMLAVVFACLSASNAMQQADTQISKLEAVSVAGRPSDINHDSQLLTALLGVEGSRTISALTPVKDQVDTIHISTALVRYDGEICGEGRWVISDNSLYYVMQPLQSVMHDLVLTDYELVTTRRAKIEKLVGRSFTMTLATMIAVVAIIPCIGLIIHYVGEAYKVRKTILDAL